MIKSLIVTICLIATISLSAKDDFNEVVDSLIKQELKKIPKPPTNLNLVKYNVPLCQDHLKTQINLKKF